MNPAQTARGESGGLILIKWGGSLITDKQLPETPRLEVIERLAAELADLAARYSGRLILGHGSGSFGHAAARAAGLAGKGATSVSEDGADASPERLAGIASTQDQAARLHRMVIAALRSAGAAPFSVAPGSSIVADGGEASAVALGPVLQALELGLLPVVFGDVVLDRERGATIFSTEQVFLTLTRELRAAGRTVERAIWLGETDGIYDASGRTVGHVTRADLEGLTGVVGGSTATDVTGGMSHRLEFALTLADLGAESLVLDGRTPGAQTLGVEGRDAGGTRVTT